MPIKVIRGNKTEASMQTSTTQPSAQKPGSDWQRWVTTLLNAAVSGASTAFLAQGFGVSTTATLKMAGGAALVSAVKWYLQHPPPGAEQ
jgi:hypothetical protein